jgi:phage FluMu gp28-like protein
MTDALAAHAPPNDLPAVLLPYQQRLLASTAQVVVYEKSRRIGISWAAAAAAVLASSVTKAADGMDTLYLGYEKEMTRGFIDDCAMWAKHFSVAAGDVEEFLFEDRHKDGDRSIQAFRINFASGFEIVALTSRPRNLRGKQGFVILDEAAFMDDLPEMLKAAFALLIWGGRVWVVSTHDGVDNAFNELIEECRAGKKPFQVLRTTFDDALQDGLYRRICLSQGKEWTAEGEAEWAGKIRANYGAGAAEELDVIPAQGSGVYLTRSVIEACATSPGEVLKLVCPPGFELKPEAERRSYVDAWLEQNVQPHLDRLDRNLRHVFGHDFALTGDASIYVPLAVQRDLRRTVPFVIEMRNVPHEQQKQVVFYVTERLPRFSAGKLDATGNGSFLAQVTAQKFGQSRVEAVMLSQAWYRENMPPLKAAFEDRTIEIVANADHADDLRQISMVGGVPMVPKTARTKGTDGFMRHGDFAPALALAIAASRADAVEYAYQAVTPQNRMSGADDAGGDDFRGRYGGAFNRNSGGPLAAQLRTGESY